jgi:hypothetical protein
METLLRQTLLLLAVLSPGPGLRPPRSAQNTRGGRSETGIISYFFSLGTGGSVRR